VVGCSRDSSKEAHRVPAYLQAHGYRIVPVNPTADAILGERAFRSVEDIREAYDLVEIFRPSEDVPPFVDQALRGPAKVIWMQTGISNDASARKAEAAGRIVVQDLCMRTEHMRLLGGRRAP
ncbi:MAG: CoA-binding protein, partial [Burkholderiales bacterium]